MAKVVFNPAHFKGIYPQFAGISDTQLEWFFKKSEQILDNSENSCIDEDTRLIWFYLLVAHYAQLQTQIQSGNSAVGRISSATEGSVSVSLDYPTSAVGREKWFNQTPHGAEYWMMTAPYRTGLYVVTNVAMPVDRSRYPQPR